MAIEPITRVEQIMSGKSLTPIIREEMFLAKAGGQDVQTPTPITRKEMFLQKIAENGGGGSGGSGGSGITGKWLFQDVQCLQASLDELTVAPTAGKIYILFVGSSPKGVGVCTNTGALVLTDGVSAAMRYEANDNPFAGTTRGWKCGNSMHGTLPAPEYSVREYDSLL